MRKLYRAYRKAGASHKEAVICSLLTPIVIAGGFTLFVALFFGFGVFAAGVKGL